MQIGMRIYYDITTGNVIQEVSERSGNVIETTREQDIADYSALAERVPETVGMLQLDYGAYAADRAAGGIITRINLETLEPLFTYPESVDPETPQEPRPALSKQVDQLAEESNANQLALMELHMMVLSVVPDEA